MKHWKWPLGRRAAEKTDEVSHSDNPEAGIVHRSAGFGQKIVAAKAELSRTIGAPKMPPLLIGAGVGLLVFTVAVVAERFIHDIAESAFKDMIRGNLKRLARAAASSIDPEKHQTFVSPKQESTAAYRNAIRPLEKFQNSDTEISYVYTCVRKGKQIFFVLDPTPPGELTEDGVESKSHIMDPYPEATAELVAAFDMDMATADSQPYSDRWGTFISGYAPIKNEKGKTVGIVGVDLAADDYAARLAGLHGAYRNGVLIAGLLALLSGIAAGSMQAKSVAIHREAQVRDKQYREQIALTLERVESALKIAEVSRKRFSDLFEGIPVSCLTFDTDGKVFEWNSQALSTFQLEPADVLERHLSVVLGREIFGGHQERLVRQLLMGKSFSGETWTDGSRYFLISGHALFGPEGDITGGILAAVDITRQKSAEDRVAAQLEDLNLAHRQLNRANEQLQSFNEQLEALATTDMLTGLPNRRAFYDGLRTAMAEARRGADLALVQADIDYFKMFNDVYGHFAGDEVLKLFGAALRDSLRPGDMVARHGGEEFYVILHNANREHAGHIVKRLQEAVARIESGYGRVTASFGIAVWNPTIESEEQLMQISDDALYEAKRQGRNCAIFGQPSQSTPVGSVGPSTSEGNPSTEPA